MPDKLTEIMAHKRLEVAARNSDLIFACYASALGNRTLPLPAVVDDWVVEQLEVLGKQFARWLVKRYGSLEKAKQAWDGTANEKDDFAKGQAGLFKVWHMTQNLTGGLARRVNDECR